MVAVDDCIPVDTLGQPLLVSALPTQLWPLLLSKAVLQVMAANEVCMHPHFAPCVSSGLGTHNSLSRSHADALVQVLELSSPHEVPAFHWLTGWLREDVLSIAPGEGAAQALQVMMEPSVVHLQHKLVSIGLPVTFALLVRTCNLASSLKGGSRAGPCALHAPRGGPRVTFAGHHSTGALSMLSP